MTLSFVDVIAHVCHRLGLDLPYRVGGQVRDQLLGRESHDWDLVGRQARRMAKAVARRLGASLITLDEQFRIYRVVVKGVTLDFAELHGKDLRQDLGRRDFTINAMAAPLLPSREIVDPFGGQNDLKRALLRAVSRTAFEDDPLRLLRGFRLAAQFDLKIEPRTGRWMAENPRRLERVARERIREEFLRLLSLPRASPALEAMDRSGLLTTVFPELEAGRRVARAYYGKGGVLKHHLQSVANLEWLLSHLDELAYIENKTLLEKVRSYVAQPVGGLPRSAFLKLGALLHDIGKPATAEMIRGRLRFFGHEDVGAEMVRKTLRALRFSRQENQLVGMWVRNHMRAGNLASAPQLTEKAVARFFRDMGDDAVGMLLVSLADHYTYLARKQWGKARDAVEKTAQRLLTAYYLKRERVLPPRILDGHRLMKALKLKPGPLIGKLLEAVQDGQAGGKLRTPREALAYAQSKLKGLVKSLQKRL